MDNFYIALEIKDAKLLERWVGDNDSASCVNHFSKHNIQNNPDNFTINKFGECVDDDDGNLLFKYDSKEEYIKYAEMLADCNAKNLNSSTNTYNAGVLGYYTKEDGGRFVKFRRYKWTPPVNSPKDTVWEIVIYKRDKDNNEPLIVSYYLVRESYMKKLGVRRRDGDLPPEELKPNNYRGKVFYQELADPNDETSVVIKEEEFDTYKDALTRFNLDKSVVKCEKIKWGKVDDSATLTRKNATVKNPADNQNFHNDEKLEGVTRHSQIEKSNDDAYLKYSPKDKCIDINRLFEYLDENSEDYTADSNQNQEVVVDNTPFKDLYDDLGKEIFSPQNIEDFKYVGRIDADTGLPVDFDDSETSGMYKYTWANVIIMVGYDFENIDYFVNLLRDKFNENFPNGLIIELDCDDFCNIRNASYGSRYDCSTEFVRACYYNELFDYTYPSCSGLAFDFCKPEAEYVSDEVKNKLESLGFDRNIFTILENKDEDEFSQDESKLADTLCSAVGLELCYENENRIYKWFENNVRHSIPSGCTLLNRKYIDEPFRLLVTGDSFSNNSGLLEALVDYVIDDEYDSFQTISDLPSVLHDAICSEMSSSFDFRVPDSCWGDVISDYDSFNDVLLDEIINNFG